MAVSTWFALEDTLSPAMLTVRAQTIPPNDMGQLFWDIFFPRQDVPTIDLYDVVTIDERPVADRREWNARGRLIPPRKPATRRVSIVPVESRDKIDEKAMQRLRESTGGNADILREVMGTTLERRVDRLSMANFRRLELDSVTAWTTGIITQRNPENAAQTYAASFGFDTARLNTAGTAWNDAGVNAYNLLLTWISSAEDKVGPIKGAVMRLATLNAILADAPTLPGGETMTRAMLAERVTSDRDRNGPFQFYINENSVDVFDDGGLTWTRTKVWPTHIIAAVPDDGVIGRMAFAPVIRAQDMVAQVGGAAGIDVRGSTVYYEESNGGRELAIEVQLNAIPIPDEQRLFVTDVGV